jgi:NAD+ synthase
MMDYQQEIKNRSDWIRGIIEEAGAKGVMLGLSGGKDSAVVAGLCAAAGVRISAAYLPIESDFNKDMKFIMPLVEKYGIDFIAYGNDDLVPIWKSISILIDRQNAHATQMASANIKARLRMTMLYALAQVRGYLVAGTGNASEAYVGYFTKWGDGAHDFNPIGDLTVEEVVALGDALGLPQEIVHRIPSAGLWEGQTDEDEMGVSYADIGRVIRDIPIYNDSATYDKINRMHRATEHKRNPIPIYHR